MSLEPIGNLVGHVTQCDPAKLGRESITYLDISSVDRETKRIIAPERIGARSAPSRARQEVYADDVLISTVRPNLNAVALVPPQFDGEVASTGFCVLRPSKDRVCPQYLFYFTQTDRFVSHLTRISTGASYPAVTDNDVLETQIPLPNLPEQQRIAGQLKQADRLRRTRRYALELSGTFLPAAFLQLFGDHVRNPKNFRIAELGEFLTFVTSGSRGWAEYYVPDGDRFIRSLDVRMNHISDEDAMFVNAPEGAEAHRTRVKTGDVLLTITGSQIGRVAPVPPRVDGAFVSQHVAILRLTPGLLPVFLSMFMSLESGGQRQIARLQYGQTKPGLSLGQIHEFKVPVPPLPMQQQFASLVARHERLRAVQRESLRQAEHLFQSLLHRAFDMQPIES